MAFSPNPLGLASRAQHATRTTWHLCFESSISLLEKETAGGVAFASHNPLSSKPYSKKGVWAMKKRSSKGTRFFEAELENPILGIRPVLDTDLTRDNFENDPGDSDFQDL